MTQKSVTTIYSGDVDFVDLYNQAVLSMVRKPKKKTVVSKQGILVTSPRTATDTISAYTTLKQSEGLGITVSDVLAKLNEASTYEDIYDSPDTNYSTSSSYIRIDANKVMSGLLEKIEFARLNGTTVPLILAEDYFGTIAGFLTDLKEELEAERRVDW